MKRFFDVGMFFIIACAFFLAVVIIILGQVGYYLTKEIYDFFSKDEEEKDDER